jgi:hypothetical protein
MKMQDWWKLGGGLGDVRVLLTLRFHEANSRTGSSPENSDEPEASGLLNSLPLGHIFPSD